MESNLVENSRTIAIHDFLKGKSTYSNYNGIVLEDHSITYQSTADITSSYIEYLSYKYKYMGLTFITSPLGRIIRVHIASITTLE